MKLLFDAANTLIYKPKLFTSVHDILKGYGHDIPHEYLIHQHRLVSEIIEFPDRTNKSFYMDFNSHWLYSLGVIPNQEILLSIYNQCSYLPWQTFSDTGYLKEIKHSVSILSNFNNSLDEHINNFFPDTFESVIVSEKEKVRKPQIEFYQLAVERLNVPPSEILYVGDSIKLDIEPAEKMGINAWLIDRTNNFPYFQKRIKSLNELKNMI